MLYVFIDPFNELTSGVTTYVNTAAELLRSVGHISTIVIARYPQEDLNSFRIRVGTEISLLPKDGLFVEAPETLYTTKYLKPSTTIHIRLHGSRQLGRKLQGLEVDQSELEAEKKEIERAAYISAPSLVAEISSKKLYGSNLSANLYPNPCPQPEETTESIDKSFDVLFLGRWQEMKGADYVKKIRKYRPDLKIAIACTKKPSDIPKGITWLPVKNAKDRTLAILSSKLVLIPSLFETASMVGLEALINKRPIVAWNHLGICEYANKELIFSAAPGEITDLINAINQAISSLDNLIEKKFQNSIDLINSCFIQGFNQSAKLIEQCNMMPFPGKEFELEGSLQKMMSEKMKNDRKIIFYRKLKKLVKNPKQFLIDSKGLSWLLKKGSSNKRTGVPIIENHENNLNNERQYDKKDLDAVDPQIPKNHAINQQVNKIKINSNKHANSLGSIPPKGYIKIQPPPSKPTGWVTVLVHKIDDKDRANELYAKLISMGDFSPFSREKLTSISIDIDPHEETLSILNRIDVANKERFSSVSNFIFIDAPLNIIEAIRATGPYVRTIVVRTDYSESYPILCGDFIDALITSVPSDLGILGLRRANYFSSIDTLSQVLRKVVQETGPKSPNMLIPLIGCLEHSNEYLEFDSNRYQGIIFTNSRVNEKSKDFIDYLEKFSGKIIGMMVAESVYMRYRGMCEAIETGGNPTELLKQSLFDGVIYDVREIN